MAARRGYRRYLSDSDNPSIPKTSRKRWRETEVLPFHDSAEGKENEGNVVLDSTSNESVFDLKNTESTNDLHLGLGPGIDFLDMDTDDDDATNVTSTETDNQYVFSDVENEELDIENFEKNNTVEDSDEEIDYDEHAQDISAMQSDESDTDDIQGDDESDMDSDNGLNSDDEPCIPNANDFIHNNSDITKGQAIVTLVAFILRHHLTSAAVVDMLEMLEIFCPGMFPSSSFLLFKGLLPQEEYYDAHLFCPHCDIYLGKYSQNENLTACNSCSTELDRHKCLVNGHFFLYISIEKQLKELLKRHTLIKKSDFVEQTDLSCVFSGRVLKEHFKKEEISDNDLTLLWNCDGAPVFRSSKRSIWPLQACVNEISDDCKDNCLLIGLWFAKQKPWSLCYMKPFVDELKHLGTVGMKWVNSAQEQLHSKVYSICSSCDSCARPMFRSTTQFNGRFGCDWCLQEGETIERGDGFSRIYPPLINTPEKRTSKSFLDDALKSTETNPVNGVKGVSPLLVLPMFDIVKGFVPDYLHCVLLGVVRMFVSLWFDSKNHLAPWYLGQNTTYLSRKMISMRPPIIFHACQGPFQKGNFGKALNGSRFYCIIL